MGDATTQSTEGQDQLPTQQLDEPQPQTATPGIRSPPTEPLAHRLGGAPKGKSAAQHRVPRLPFLPLYQVLLGAKLPSPRVPYESHEFFDKTLNPSQQDAVRFALESPEVALIHGPPGVSYVMARSLGFD